ncbi:MAG: hypothetical protein ACI9J3_001211 [Parvicellaceae bacterium]|jgi:hypothetical protein
MVTSETVSLSRKPIKSELTEIQLTLIKEKHRTQGISIKRWNLMILAPITIIFTMLVLLLFYYGLTGLNDVMKIENPAPTEIHIYEYNHLYVPSELDYSPLEKE